VFSQVDLTLPTHPAPVLLARSYRDAAVRRGLLGAGWSIPFDLIARRVDQDLVVIHGGGEIRSYTRDAASNRFTGLPGEIVEVSAAGSLERRDLTGARERFDAAGRLVEVLGPNPSAGTVRFRYGGSGRLEGLVAANGRSLTLAYDAAGRLARAATSLGTSASYRYDAQGRLAEVTDEDGLVTRYGYDATNRLTRVEDPDGGWTGIEYDGRGRVARRLWHDGRWERFAYDPAARTTRVDYPDGYVITLQYDQDGLVETTRDSLGHQEVKELDPHGLLTRAVDASGIETRCTYDALGRPVKCQASDGWSLGQEYQGQTNRITRRVVAGQEWQYQYDRDGNVTVVVAPDGSRSTLAYFPNGLLKSVTDPLGHTTTYEYDQDSRLVREVNPLGGATRWTYDARGRVVSETDPLGGTTRLEYTPRGSLARIVNPLGREVRHEYDSRGLLARRIDPLGRETRFEYDAPGRLVRVRLPGGAIEAYQYDARGRVAGVTDALGRTFGFRYDGLGRLTERRGATGEVAKYQYDARGSWSESRGSGARASYRYDPAARTAEAVDPTGARTQLALDPAGRVATAVDPLGGSTRFRYGAAGELAEVEEASGERAHYIYDSAGRLVRLQHPAGGETRLGYDALGNIVSETDPLGAQTRRSFDAMGRLTSVTDANGQTIRFAYDAAHRPLRKELPSGRRLEFRYDPAGNPTRVDDPVNPIAYHYDPLGRVSAVEYLSLGKTVRYEYDARGLRTRLLAPDGREIRYQYDAAARLVAVAGPDGRPIQLAYDAAGRPAGLDYPNGVSGRAEYDVADRLTAVTYRDRAGQALAAWRYAYDAAGNPVEVRDHSGQTIRYRYDAVGQLIEEAGFEGTVRYAYLPGGDRERRETAGEVTTYRYDAAHRLSAAGVIRFEHDALGHLTRRHGPDGSTAYTHDEEGRLIEVARPNGVVVRYGYGPAGERLWREENGRRTYFVYDGLNLLGELDAAGQLRALYVHGADLDSPLAVEREGRWYYLHADAIGSIAAATADDGRVVARARFSAFGELRASTGDMPSPFGFAARERDAAASLYYFRARYYDPALGRFLSRDAAPASLTDPRTLNPYLYAKNSPLRFTDPLGLATEVTNWWLRSGGFGHASWDWLLNFRSKDQLTAGAITDPATGRVTFGPLSWLIGPRSVMAHEARHVMVVNRPIFYAYLEKAGKVIRMPLDAANAFHQDIMVRMIRENGGMTFSKTTGAIRVGSWENVMESVLAKMEVGGKRLGTEGAKQLLNAMDETAAYAAGGRYAAATGNVPGALVGGAGNMANAVTKAQLMGGTTGEVAGEVLSGLGRTLRWTAGATLRALGIAGNVYTVGSTLKAQYEEFKEARPARQAESEAYWAQLRAEDMQDGVTEKRLRNWLKRHPELIRPGVKPEDALAQMLGNLYNGQPPFEGVVATRSDLETERDRLKKELEEAKDEREKAEARQRERQDLLQKTKATIALLEQHERDRVKILTELAKLPATAQVGRQEDIKRNTQEVQEVRKQLKTNKDLERRLETDLIALKNDIGTKKYEEGRLQEKLREVEKTLAAARGALRP
jgi:RHS repeat-associated protein